MRGQICKPIDMPERAPPLNGFFTERESTFGTLRKSRLVASDNDVDMERTELDDHGAIGGVHADRAMGPIAPIFSRNAP